jgi:Fe2+ transport system protein FeoA
MTIMDLKAGDSFVVKGVELTRETGKRLADMGFTQGTEGRVVRKALFGDPLQVAILGYQVTIRKTEAAGVVVDLLEPSR